MSVNIEKTIKNLEKNNIEAFFVQTREAVNISGDPIESVTVEFEENVSKATDPERGENIGFTFSLDGYSYRVLYIK